MGEVATESDAAVGPPPAGRPWRRVVVALTLAGAVPVATLSLAAFLGGWWWLLDVAAALRPQYAAWLAAAAVVLVLLGARRSGAGIAAIALVNVAVIAPLWLDAPAAADGHETVRIHFHNVHGGGDERFHAVTGALATEEADLVILSETHPDWIELFAATTLPHAVVHPTRADEHRRLLVLSQHPIDEIRAVPLVADSRAEAVAVDLTLDGRPLRVLGLHATAPRGRDQSAVRDTELAAVAGWVAEQTVPVVVVGDLNITPWSHPFRELRHATGLRNGKHGFGLQPTYIDGTGPLMVPLDHLLHDPALTLTDRSTGPALGSTHRSLHATVGWSADVPTE
jgi:endonuclease/exonuclease/phosphatase (EEP) superfamily protein YafD